MHRRLPIRGRALRLPLAAVALGLMLTSVPTTSLAATTIAVSTTDDELNADGDCSLREAIRAANLDTAVDRCPAGSGADTIVLASSTYDLRVDGRSENAAATGDLDLTGDVTIQGNGSGRTIIDGGSLRISEQDIERVFQVQAGAKVRIVGVKLQHGGYNTSGGAIYNSGTLTLVDGALVDNVIIDSAYQGGAVYNEGTLTIQGATIARNGLGLPGRGGGIYNKGQLSVDRAFISHNSAGENGGGGGIYNDAGGNVVLTNSVVNENVSSSDDSGVQAGGMVNNGTATLANVIFIDNHDRAIANYGTMTLNSSTITKNTVSNCPIGQTCGTGGIRNRGTLYLSNTILAGNQAADCQGTLTSRGHNLIGSTTGCTIVGKTTGNQLNVDPRLAAGTPFDPRNPRIPDGARPTENSPVRDAGDPAQPGGGGDACEGRDIEVLQSGGNSLRPSDADGDNIARCDIGAIEVDAALTALNNGSFEADVDRNTSPDNWSVSSIATRSAEARRTGGYGLRLSATGDRNVSVWQTVRGLPNQQAAFGAWVNIRPTTDAFTFTVEVAWKDTAGNVLRTDTIRTFSAATSGWQQVGATLTKPALTDHAVVRLNAASLAATIYVDDVSFPSP